MPWYYQLLPLGLVNTYWAMILPQLAQSVAFGTFWMNMVFRSLPRSLSESAIIDGASRWTLLGGSSPPTRRRGAHHGRAGVRLDWNSFLLPLVMVSKQSLYVVTVGLSQFEGAHFNNYAALAAKHPGRAARGRGLPVRPARFIAGLFAGSVVE